MGAAGDMLMSALYELLSDEQKKQFLDKMNHLGVEGISVNPKRVQQCGIFGTHMEVLIHGQEEGHLHSHAHSHGEEHNHSHGHSHGEEHNHSHEHSHEEEHSHSHGHHHHYTYQNIVEEIQKFSLPQRVKQQAEKIYRFIAEAESHAHETEIEQIHFHEVGSLDAIADVVGCSLLIDMLAPDRIIVSPIHVGNGTVRCAHGILPVPAPATAYLLKGIPFYTGTIMTELCTPTGAAVLKNYADEFGTMPVMNVLKIGYGMGTKQFESVNCVRAFLGEVEDKGMREEITEICCNLDDMTPEAVSYAMEVLLEQGALDVFTTPIMMKKNRQAVMLSCLCKEEKKEEMIQTVLKYTTTIGVRYRNWNRKTLTSSFETMMTDYGVVRIKESKGYGIEKKKPEYEDIKKLATEHDVPLDNIVEAIRKREKE